MYRSHSTLDPGTRERLLASIRRHLRGILHLRQFVDSEDVLQNVLVRLLSAAEKVQPETEADLLKLAARHIRWELIDLHRSLFGPEGPGGKVTPLTGEALDAAFQPATIPEPNASIALADAVEKLPPDLKGVVDLLFYHDLTHEQAAKLLGVATKTVQRRWRNARIQLGRLLT